MKPETDPSTAIGKNGSISQWVTFLLAGETYGVNVMQVQEVLRHIEISVVPGAPEYISGIVNLRGHVVTVIDIRKKFSLPPGSLDENARIIVMEIDSRVFGILVDSVSEVVYLDEKDIAPSPNVGNIDSEKFIKGVSNQNETLLILLDLSKMIEESSEVD